MDIEKLFKEWIASKPDEQISYATAFQLLDFVAYVKKAVEQSVQRIWGTVAQNEDLPNEKMCVTCGHSESRHQTAGGFCKHCTCNEFVDPATTPNR